MSTGKVDSRRDFIKTAAAGAAGLLVAGVSGQSRVSGEMSTSALRCIPGKRISRRCNSQ
jgi:hypothetical protein